MSGPPSKYKIVFLRYLLVLAVFLVGYSLLHWWLVLRPERGWPTLPVTHWGLPAVIAVALYALFLHRRFHLLKMETKPKAGQYHKRRTERRYDNTDFSIVVIPLLVAPVIAAQYWLEDLVRGPILFPLSFHATWITTLACCIIILITIALCTDDREAWQQFEADRDYPKRLKR